MGSLLGREEVGTSRSGILWSNSIQTLGLSTTGRPGSADVPGTQMATESHILYPFVFPFCQLLCIDIFMF